MIDPLTKRAAVEGIGAVAGVVFAISITPEEISIAIAVITAALGVVVWLVRLEGRINTLVEVNELQHNENTRRLDRIAKAVGSHE